MLEIEKWVKSKPPLIAIMALQFASSAEDFHYFLNAYHEGNYLDRSEIIITPEEWIKFYFSSRYLKEYLTGTFKKLGGLASLGAEYYEMLNTIKKERAKYGHKIFNEKLKNEWVNLTIENKTEVISEIKAFTQDLIKSNLDDIQSEIDDEPDSQLQSELKNALNNPEMIFFIRVMSVCWFLYGETHTKLFWKARKGNLDSLDKLLRIDKRLIYDHKIKDIYIKSENSTNKAVFNTINNALQNRYKPKITLRKVKDKIAGMISSFSELLGYRLTIPEIQNLFDSIAHDFDKSKLIDEDLPESIESYSKAIQREKKLIKSRHGTGHKNI